MSSGPDQRSLNPRAVERPQDEGWTRIGVLHGREPSRVDRGGLVSPAGADWSFDWWIGADDRWYLPAREATVRQGRNGAGPVVVSTMRIPSGDARQTVYGAFVGGREAIVVEVENDSPVPVALALAVRPYDVDGQSTKPGPITLDDRLLMVGGRPAVVLPRPPNESGGSSDRDLLDVVSAGGDLTWPDAPVGETGSAPNAVALYPLPHRTSLRFLLLSPTADDIGPIDVAAAPDGDAVARGWSAVVEAGGRFEFPDPGLTKLIEGARSRLLLAAPTLADRAVEWELGAGDELAALALGGHRAEVSKVLDALVATFPTRLPHGAAAGAEIVAALAPAVVVTGRDPTDFLEIAVALATLVERVDDSSTARRAGAEARAGLARLARLAGDESAAAHLEREADESGAEAPATYAEVQELVAAASATGTWSTTDETAEAARFVAAARSLLVDDRGADLIVLPEYPSAWRGGGAEVHEISTKHGRLSYAIRWHGYRPALLWQLEPPTGRTPTGQAGVTIRCPALDETWSTTDPRGETLLSGSSTTLPAAPGPGDSFT